MKNIRFSSIAIFAKVDPKLIVDLTQTNFPVFIIEMIFTLSSWTTKLNYDIEIFFGALCPSFSIASSTFTQLGSFIQLLAPENNLCRCKIFNKSGGNSWSVTGDLRTLELPLQRCSTEVVKFEIWFYLIFCILLSVSGK